MPSQSAAGPGTVSTGSQLAVAVSGDPVQPNRVIEFAQGITVALATQVCPSLQLQQSRLDDVIAGVGPQ